MSNKELFITTYLEKIAEKFSINKDKTFEIFSTATILDKTFDEIYADVIIPGSTDGGIDGSYFDEQDGFYKMDITKLEGVDITVRLYETKDQDLIEKLIDRNVWTSYF